MAHRVLGLDIGSYSIKAAVFQTTFKSFQITDIYESRPLRLDELSRDEQLKVQAKALEQFVDENRIETELVVGSLSGARISSRAMNLPLKDKRQIEKVLPFELEGFLPFEMTDLLLDFDICEVSKGGTSLLAFAVKREFIKQYMDLFNNMAFSPEVVDVDVLALGNVVHTSNLPKEGGCAILDLGHQKSSLCIIKNGKVVGVRTFLTGGKHLTDSLRVDLDLTFQQAEEVKHRFGGLVLESKPSRDSQLTKISASISKILAPTILEVNQTLHNYEANTQAGIKIESIYLCGGTALIRNLDRWIADTSGRQVDFVHCEHQGARLETKIGNKESLMIQAVSLGLRTGIRGVPPNRLSRVNLRKAEFALVKDYGDIRAKFSGYAVWFVALLALGVLQFVLQIWTLSRQASKIDKQVIQEIGAIVKDVPANKLGSGKQAVNIVQGRIKQYEDKVDLLTSGLQGVTALGILKEISDRIPKSLMVDIKEMSIDRSKVFMKGDTDSFTSVDKIVSFLQQYEKFKKVEKGAITDSPEGSKKRFSISIVVGDKQEEMP